MVRKIAPLSRFKLLLRRLGPGLITGASDDDPSGIATYSQAGSQFGLATLWTALITFPLMLVMQKMCAKIGMVTSCGLATNIKNHYPKPLLFFIVLLICPAIILNISADLAGMAAVGHLVIPAIPEYLFSIFFTGILIPTIIFLPYKKISSFLKYLCLSLFVYFIIPFLSQQNWLEIFKNTFIPTIQFNKEYILILVAILGTTISPYLFFWQSTMEAEENRHRHLLRNDKESMKHMKIDVGFGMLCSNLVMYFIILTTGTILFNSGVRNIETVEQAAKALEPLAGEFSYLLFAMGIIGTGLLSIPVLVSCLAYLVSTAFNWTCGLNREFKEATPFYIVITLSLLLSLALTFINVSPIKALIYTAVLYGLTAPIMILLLLHICNNKKIMGKHTNSMLSNILGWFTFILMTSAAVLLLYFQFYD